MFNLIVLRLRELSKQVHYTAPTRQHLQQAQRSFQPVRASPGVWTSAKVRKSCRSRKMLQDEYSFGKSASIQLRTSLPKFVVRGLHLTLPLRGFLPHSPAEVQKIFKVDPKSAMLLLLKMNPSLTRPRAVSSEWLAKSSANFLHIATAGVMLARSVQR